MSEEFLWVISAFAAVGIVFSFTFIFHLIRAPIYLRWEEERKPKISVIIHHGKRQYDWQHQHLMWAEIEVKNDSIAQPLKDVEIKVTELKDVLRPNGNQYQLYEVNPLSPMGICWSERVSPPRQLKIDIAPGSSKEALLASCDDSNGLWSVFNVPIANKPRHLGGARLKLVISSLNSNIWCGYYFLECHPNYAGATISDYQPSKFEFVEWDKWVADHNATIV